MGKILFDLNLNKTPQQVKSNSLIFAKNIKLDETASAIVRDDNLTYSDVTSYCKEHYPNHKIVGCITTPREILVFVYSDSQDIVIIRHNEDHRMINEIITSLKYNGGEFIGTYNYNIRNELIIIFSEKNARVDVPLRTINLGEFNWHKDDIQISKTVYDESEYNIIRDVPVVKCLGSIIDGITIPSGTYNFFIRYKVDGVYTDWFPIGKTYYAIRLEDTVVYNCSTQIADGKYANETVNMNLNNVNQDCNYGFKLRLTFSLKPDYITDFQIGYILRHDNSFVGRIYGNYSITDNTEDILFNANYIDTEDINNFTKTNFNLYNVSNIVNYGNRVYISNYKENNNNVIFDVSNIKLRWSTRDISEGKLAINDNNTLKADEVYNFFIHFVRKDGSYTNGIRLDNDADDYAIINSTKVNLNDKAENYNLEDFIDTTDSSLKKLLIYKFYNNANNGKFGYYINSNGDKLFRAPDVKNKIISLEIECPEDSIPEGYIGYFISYEKVESVLLYECFLRKTSGSNVGPIDLYKSYDAEISDSPIIGNLIKSKDSKKWYKINNIKLWPSNTFDKTIGTHGGIEINSSVSENVDQNTAGVYQVLSTEKDIYANENKVLYKLTDVFCIHDLYSQQDDNFSDFNYPSYINNTSFYISLYRAVENPDTKLFDLIDGETFFVNNSDTYYYLVSDKRQEYLYSNLNINCLSFKQKPSLIFSVQGNNTKVLITYIPISNISDAFEIKSDYLLSAGINSLMNYSAYNKDYPTIEQFDNTVRRSDVFANESIENAWRNFGGENYKVISNTRGKIKKLIPLGKYFLIHLEQGLFVFDRDNKMKLQDKEIQLSTPDTFDLEAQEVYSSENGFLGLQDEDSTIINSYGYTFYENDTKTIYNYYGGNLSILSLPIQRLIENIDINKVSMSYDVANSRVLMCFFSGSKSFTISYHYITKTFISLHDFKFNKSWNTKVCSYLRTTDDKNLLVFTKQKYEDTYREANIVGKGQKEIFKIVNNYNEQIFPAIADVYQDKVNSYSIVDIICNDAYDTPKVLNTIKYILSKINRNNCTTHQAEDNLKLEYCGDYIMIYSDRCSTDYQDLNIMSNDFGYGNYKKPWNDKGIWNYNYFRNIIDNLCDSSDEKSLIYGKYFVVRFVFKPDTLFKLENIIFDINKY